MISLGIQRSGVQIPPGGASIETASPKKQPPSKETPVEEAKQKLKDPAEPSPGQVWSEPVTGMEFVWVPAGQKKANALGSEFFAAALGTVLRAVCVPLVAATWIRRTGTTVSVFALRWINE
jgi:hypothetical protein